jgi:hypothetical protein
MGVSREVGAPYAGCPPHSPQSPLPDELLTDCRAWQAVVYALDKGRIAPLPFADGEAPPLLVLSDFGRQLRYWVMNGPVIEIWDQLDLTARAE